MPGFGAFHVKPSTEVANATLSSRPTTNNPHKKTSVVFSKKKIRLKLCHKKTTCYLILSAALTSFSSSLMPLRANSVSTNATKGRQQAKEG